MLGAFWLPADGWDGDVPGFLLASGQSCVRLTMMQSAAVFRWIDDNQPTGKGASQIRKFSP